MKPEKKPCESWYFKNRKQENSVKAWWVRYRKSIHHPLRVGFTSHKTWGMRRSGKEIPDLNSEYLNRYQTHTQMKTNLTMDKGTVVLFGVHPRKPAWCGKYSSTAANSPRETHYSVLFECYVLKTAVHICLRSFLFFLMTFVTCFFHRHWMCWDMD